MAKKIGTGTYLLEHAPSAAAYAAIVGQMEGEGPLGACFDYVEQDSYFGKDSWEQAESELQRRTVGTALQKAELTAQFGNSPVDTGNPKVQVAILSERIKELTEHMKSHQKDFHTRRGLLMLVGRRRRLLSYIKKNDIVEYRELIKALGIRDNIQ